MNSATRCPDRCLIVLRPVPDPRVVTRDGVALFTMSPSASPASPASQAMDTQLNALPILPSSLGPFLAA